MTGLSKWTPESDPAVLRRVGKLGEECAEVLKVCSRITIQGLNGIDPSSGRTNKEELAREIADVMAQCFVTIEKLGMDAKAIDTRRIDKEVWMGVWEEMHSTTSKDGLFTPKAGELVRYGDGSTALVLHGIAHAGGWHGVQCMGGTTFYNKLYRPSMSDRNTWVECAVKHRGVPLAQALAEAGFEQAKEK